MAYVLLDYQGRRHFRPRLDLSLKPEHGYWGKSDPLPEDAKLPADPIWVLGPDDEDGVRRPDDFTQSFNGVVVSERFKDLIERLDPEACRFTQVSLTEDPHKTKPIPGNWYFVTFYKSGNPILEDRSTLIFFINTQDQGNSPPPKAKDAKLYCYRGAVRDLTFWCGQGGDPVLPADLSRKDMLYLSDAFFDAALEAGITGLNHAVKIEELPDDDMETIAPGAPCQAEQRYERTGKRFYRIREVTFDLEPEEKKNDWVKECYEPMERLMRGGLDESAEGWVNLLPDGPLIVEASRDYHFQPPAYPQFWMNPFNVVSEELRDVIEALQPGRQQFVPIQVFFTDEHHVRHLTPGERFLTRPPYTDLTLIPELSDGLKLGAPAYPLRQKAWSVISSKKPIAAIDLPESDFHFFCIDGIGNNVFISEEMRIEMSRISEEMGLDFVYPDVQININCMNRRISRFLS